MSELSMPPTESFQQPSPEVRLEQQEVSDSPQSSKAWLVVGLLAVVVAVLVGAVVWRVFSRGAQPSLNNGVVPNDDSQNTLATQPVPELSTEVFETSEESVLEVISVWEDPLSTNPCYVTGDGTCQFSFARLGGGALRIQSFILPKKQEVPDLFFLFSRMLVSREGVYAYYQPTLVTGKEPQPYTAFLDDVYEAGQLHAVNPAFIFTVYNSLFTSAGELGYSQKDILEILPPEKFAGRLAVYLDDKPLADFPLVRQELEAKEWSPESKALVHSLAVSLNPVVVTQMLSEPLSLENEYYRVFAPSQLLGDVTANLGSTSLGVAEVFPPADSDIAQYDYAICQAGVTYLCNQTSDVASCSPFPFFDYYCPRLTNIP